ncbi:hypothetical protein PGIGA_G00162520 [Pangasianodon gigas]|uniref:Uncharacterized protein n=1 Tax=Pangasianodon gigas TaxID=30993 RepID=A0ACC5XS25_PANGG|nr:hypothetical protein [Pangasianodon gigas]
MKCCGYNNYTDFTGSLFVNHTSEYPQFCCSTSALPSKKCDFGNAASAHVEGCFNVVVKLVKKNSALLGGVAICVAAIEVAAMIVALILYKT